MTASLADSPKPELFESCDGLGACPLVFKLNWFLACEKTTRSTGHARDGVSRGFLVLWGGSPDTDVFLHFRVCGGYIPVSTEPRIEASDRNSRSLTSRESQGDKEQIRTIDLSAKDNSERRTAAYLATLSCSCGLHAGKAPPCVAGSHGMGERAPARVQSWRALIR